MEEPHRLKRVVWIGSSWRDLKSFPDDVKRAIGFALYQAQVGDKAPSASLFPVLVMRAFSKLLQTTTLILTDAFQKKSKRGSATPKPDVALIKTRLKNAQEDYKYRVG